MTDPQIVKLTPNEFTFEYTDVREAPKLEHGQVFEYRGQKHKIIHTVPGFIDFPYYSCMVVAEAID
jgi:hypothetical protein